MSILGSSSPLPRGISAILFAVRKSFLLTALLILACSCILVAGTIARSGAQAQAPAQNGTPQQPSVPQQAPPVPAAPQTPATTGPVVVLDPGHGGTDTGARGEGGAVEKDVVLEFARVVRGELESQGYHVVMTRNDDSNPSYDDRAAIANAYRDSVFISIHVSSTGTVGTARAYYDQFWNSIPAPAAGTIGSKPAPPPSPGPPSGVVPWEEAQRPYVNVSHRLADILQGELVLRFSGSPIASTGIALRDLRSVEAPAVAVEISSVSVSDPNSLRAMAAPLATSIARSILAFHPVGQTVTP